MPEQPFKDTGRARRKSGRRDFHYSAILVGPDNLQWSASIIDISEAGAQLQLQHTQSVPDEILLMIGGKSEVRRECHIRWRSETRIGVQFVRRQIQTLRAAYEVKKKISGADRGD
ncbi:MAG: PilZ domain-containing protein [Xanthobacteraceae bacterium]|nr:PilZ domain-containing protein [Xanthobacteraceae bacterium]